MHPIRTFISNHHPTPARFFGYNTKTLPLAVRRARIVLMASEPKKNYQANILNDVPNPDRLLQVRPFSYLMLNPVTCSESLATSYGLRACMVTLGVRPS